MLTLDLGGVDCDFAVGVGLAAECGCEEKRVGWTDVCGDGDVVV